MRVAFYAPLKPPDDPVPSGDRRMARLLLRATRLAGHDSFVASRLRARDGDGTRHPAIRARAAARAAALVERHRSQPPDLWLTYHVYYKAPDWLGPAVSVALNIPYVIVEASDAPKRATGPWALGHNSARQAIRAAHRIVCLNPGDRPCLEPLVAAPARLTAIAPFIDTAPYADAAAARARHRARLAADHGLPVEAPWVVAVAMMRAGDKLDSYRRLASAWSRLPRPRTSSGTSAPRLLIAGDGPASPQVGDAFRGLEGVVFLGRQDSGKIAALLGAADLFAWPAVAEAFGMAILEAQAAGLPVVAGRSPGVAQIVEDGESGILTPMDEPAAFAAALADLLADGRRRLRMGTAARAKADARHGLPRAALELDAILREARAEASS